MSKTIWPSAGILFLLSMIVGTATLNVNTFIPAMPAISLALGASYESVQLSLSIFMWGYAAGQLIVGPLSDHFGRMAVFRVGLAAYTVSNLVCVWVSSIETLLLLRLAQGLLAATGPVLVRAILNDRMRPSDAARTLSTVLSIMALVPALAPIASGWLVDIFDWRAIFIGTTAFCFVLTVASQLWLEESLEPNKRTRGIEPLDIASGYFQVATNRAFWRNVAVATGMFSAMFAYNSVNSFLIISDLGIRERYHGFTFAVVAFAFIGGSLLGNRLSVRYSLERVIEFAIYLGIASSALAYLSSLNFPLSLGLVVLPGIAIFFANGFALSAAMARAIGTSVNHRGSASALVGFFQIGSAGIIGTLTASLYDHTTQPLHLVMLACVLFSAVIWHILKPTQSTHD